MKIDNIEDFVKANKESFQENVPLEEMWLNIESKLNEKRRTNRIKSFTVAASLLILFASSMFVFQLKKSNSNNSDQIINQEVVEAQTQFSSLIEIKKSELNQYKNSQPELVNELNKQLQDLQSNYKLLVPQLHDENKKDLIVQALIENLQLQLEIINRSLEIIHNINNESHEKEAIQL